MTVRPLLSLREVEKTYPGAAPVPALRPTTLRIEAGDLVGVVGPSGSGKSTLLNLLGLLDTPTSGTYEVAGVDVEALDETERTSLRAGFFGFVFQAFHLVPSRSAVENVELGMLYRAVPRDERRSRSVEALTRVGLAHRMSAVPSTLSGGERQRVAVARAIAARPRVILCDEPTGNLDSKTATGILELLGQLHSDGLTVVIVTHNPGITARCRRVVEVSDGSVTEVGA